MLFVGILITCTVYTCTCAVKDPRMQQPLLKNRLQTCHLWISLVHLSHHQTLWSGSLQKGQHHRQKGSYPQERHPSWAGQKGTCPGKSRAAMASSAHQCSGQLLLSRNHRPTQSSTTHRTNDSHTTGYRSATPWICCASWRFWHLDHAEDRTSQKMNKISVSN